MTRGQEKYTTLQHAVIVGVSDDSRLTRQDVHIFRLSLSLQRRTQEAKKHNKLIIHAHSQKRFLKEKKIFHTHQSTKK